MSCRAKFNTMTNFSNFMLKTRQKEGKQTGEKIDHQIIYICILQIYNGIDLMCSKSTCSLTSSPEILATKEHSIQLRYVRRMLKIVLSYCLLCFKLY